MPAEKAGWGALGNDGLAVLIPGVASPRINRNELLLRYLAASLSSPLVQPENVFR